MKLCWLTDIHLDHRDEGSRLAFYQTIQSLSHDAVVISGDIADSSTIIDILIEMKDCLQKPIYFVLGNHDFYGSNLATVYSQVNHLVSEEQLLTWLTEEGHIALTKSTALIGVDGWSDGREGNYEKSPVALNDSRFISDFLEARKLGKTALLDKMQAVAEIDAQRLRAQLTSATTAGFSNIIIMTHPVPFKAACWYRGKPGNEDWIPFFTSQILGQVLTEFAQEYSDITFNVLCGHTHTAYEYQPYHNLNIKVGGAVYEKPEIQAIIEAP